MSRVLKRKGRGANKLLELCFVLVLVLVLVLVVSEYSNPARWSASYRDRLDQRSAWPRSEQPSKKLGDCPRVFSSRLRRARWVLDSIDWIDRVDWIDGGRC